MVGILEFFITYNPVVVFIAMTLTIIWLIPKIVGYYRPHHRRFITFWKMLLVGNWGDIYSDENGDENDLEENE